MHALPEQATLRAWQAPPRLSQALTNASDRARRTNEEPAPRTPGAHSMARRSNIGDDDESDDSDSGLDDDDGNYIHEHGRREAW